MSASIDHMGAFAEQLRREVYPLRTFTRPWRLTSTRLFIAMWEAIEDPILVVPIRRRIPGRKQSDHLRQVWHYRQQARRFEARP